MEKDLGWHPGDTFSIKVDDRGPTGGAHFYRPGPVVGVVPTGVTPRQMLTAPTGTRFFGKVYVVPGKTKYGDPGEIIAVYERAKLPNREEVPVCVVVGGKGLFPVEEFKEDTAKSISINAGHVVDRWP